VLCVVVCVVVCVRVVFIGVVGFVYVVCVVLLFVWCLRVRQTPMGVVKPNCMCAKHITSQHARQCGFTTP
jgi:hypothetical protein